VSGSAGSVIDLFRDSRLPTRIPVKQGVLAAESATLLRAFFADRRGG
jgi:tRNA(adenine34) deaminase